MGVVSWLRGIANGMLMLVILDTLAVTVAIGSGVPVPSYAYFAIAVSWGVDKPMSCSKPNTNEP